MSGLRAIIEEEIQERGPIPFSRYMELCLYHPELGYYSRHAEQFGKAGDFYTSSDVHAVFGRLLARQFDEMWRMLGSPSNITVRELGPGRGLFAQDVMDWSEKKFPDFFDALRYELVEKSPALREKISQVLSRRLESGEAILESSEESKSSSIRSGVNQGPSIVFANEFFDAIPVEVVSCDGALRIDIKDGKLIETWVPASKRELEYLDRYSVHPEKDERIEIGLQSMNLFASSVEVSQGLFVAVDYGYTREELLAGRHRGTLKAIRQHSVSASPYEAPGEQDITADVNFTALAAAAHGNGMLWQKLVTQSQFLLGIGEANQFADAFEDCKLPQERAKVALQLKHLITPAGMGESFHVMIATKGVDPELTASLAGLNFGQKRR